MGSDSVRDGTSQDEYLTLINLVQNIDWSGEDVCISSSVSIFIMCFLTPSSYPQLIGARMCLAVAEAGLFAGVVY